MCIWREISLTQSGMRCSEWGSPGTGCVPGDGEMLGRDAVRYMDVKPDGNQGSACSSRGQEWGFSPWTTHPDQAPAVGLSPLGRAASPGAR